MILFYLCDFFPDIRGKRNLVQYAIRYLFLYYTHGCFIQFSENYKISQLSPI